MSLENPVIAVIGAGAVGGYYGARLAQHGHKIHFHMRSDHTVVRQKGLHVQSCDGDFVLEPTNVRAYDHPRQMPPADLVLVTLKTTANDHLKSLIEPVLKSDTAILTLQNGLGNEERLAELFGEDRVLGGMAFVCINRIGPGHIAHTDHGLIRLGEYRGGLSKRARRIAELLNSSNIRCQAVDNLMAGRWEKLVWNVPFNGLGALLDLTTDKLLASTHGLELVRRLMREVITGARGGGVTLSPALVEEKIRHTESMGAYRSSMQVDRQMNRAMEIEAILGNPVRVAGRAGIATPSMELLYHQLAAINNGTA